MKTIIAGSRNYHDYETLKSVINSFQAVYGGITEVVSGGAKGVDAMGERWASENNIPVKIFLADWRRLGRSAGPIRNIAMSEYADALVAINLNGSSGTNSIIHVFGESRPHFIKQVNYKETK